MLSQPTGKVVEDIASCSRIATCHQLQWAHSSFTDVGVVSCDGLCHCCLHFGSIANCMRLTNCSCHCLQISPRSFGYSILPRGTNSNVVEIDALGIAPVAKGGGNKFTALTAQIDCRIPSKGNQCTVQNWITSAVDLESKTLAA